MSNVQVLLNAKDDFAEKYKSRKEDFDRLLDEILEFGTPFDFLPTDIQLEHSYNSEIKIEENLAHFMAGFTALRQKKIVQNCPLWLDS